MKELHGRKIQNSDFPHYVAPEPVLQESAWATAPVLHSPTVPCCPVSPTPRQAHTHGVKLPVGAAGTGRKATLDADPCAGNDVH